MKLFKNNVGRPSNEIIKKRRIFISIIFIFVVLLVMVSYHLLLENINVANLKGLTAKDFKITSKLEGTLISDGKAQVNKEGNYKVYFELQNDTKSKVYYKWITYFTNSINSDNISYMGECIPYDSSVKFEPKLTMSNKYPNRTAVLRVYGSENNCKKDKGNKIASYINQEEVSYELHDLATDLTIDLKLEGNKNKKGIYLFDSVGTKRIDYVLKNNTGKTRYYRWFSYKTNEISSNRLANVGSCIPYNSTVNGYVTLGVTEKNPNRAGMIRIYADEDSCYKDSTEKKNIFIKEEKIFYSLNKENTLLYVNKAPTGVPNAFGIVPADTEKDYNTKFTLNNLMGEERYYRWFTYGTHDIKKTPTYKGSCTKYNDTITKTWGLTVSDGTPYRAGQIKVYNNLSACKADNNSTSSKNVVTTSVVKYGLRDVYTSTDGFKMIWYDHKALSSKVGVQHDNLCAYAAYSYGAFILSKGKIVTNKRNSYASLGAYDANTNSKKQVFNLIKTKIDAGIPVIMHTKSTGTHWVTVVGYKPGKSASKMSLSDIYIVDPFYNEAKYSKKDVILWRGVASKRKTAKKFHSDYDTRTWKTKSSVKKP